MTREAHRRLLHSVIVLTLLAGLLINEWTARYFFSPDDLLASVTRLKIRGLQVLLLSGGVMLWLFRKRIAIKVLVANVVVLIFSLMAVEGLLLMMLSAPALLPPGRLLWIARELYDAKTHTIQYLPDCAEYDRLLGYRLRPGTCSFSNREFDTELFVNSLGLRDKEEDLTNPEIIVLGDSHAMGWGVEQDDTFAEVLERLTGRKTLNAATSSYGTARQMLRLAQLDLDSLDVLILQYSDNDVQENKVYYEQRRLPVMTDSTYDSLVKFHTNRSRYTFGEHFFRLINSRLLDPPAYALARTLDLPLPDSSRRPSPTFTPREEADYFLHVLLNSGVPLDTVHLVVLEINSHAKNDRHFIEAVQNRLHAHYTHLPHVTLLDVSSVLTTQHYYRLDHHMNADGHTVLAQLLASRLATKDDSSGMNPKELIPIHSARPTNPR